MARDFNGSTGTLVESSALFTTPPITIAGWFNSDVSATSQTIACIDTNGGTARYQLALSSTASGTVLAQATNTSGTNGNSNTISGSGNYTAGVWGHAAAVFNSTTSRTAYLNGIAGTTNTTSITVSGVDETRIAARFTGGSLGLYFNGRLAEIAYWNAALSADEILMLSRGISPLMVRPSALASYCPITGNDSPEVGFMGAGAFTLAGTAPKAEHVRILKPSRHRTIYIPAAAGGGVSISVPLATLSLTNNVPTIATGASVAVPLNTLSITGNAPVIGTGVLVAVPAGSLTITDNAPTLTVGGGVNVSVPVAVITITGQLPTVATGASVAVPLNQLTVTGAAPTVATGTSIAVPLNQITITGQAPSLAAADGVTISVPVSRMRMTEFTPTYEAGSLMTLVSNTAYEVYVKQGNGHWEHTRVVFTGTDFGSPQ